MESSILEAVLFIYKEQTKSCFLKRRELKKPNVTWLFSSFSAFSHGYPTSASVALPCTSLMLSLAASLFLSLFLLQTLRRTQFQSNQCPSFYICCVSPKGNSSVSIPALPCACVLGGGSYLVTQKSLMDSLRLS